MRPPTIPTILTASDWDKQKGIVAKIVGKETGIGAAMNVVKSAYQDIKWDKFALQAFTPSDKIWSPDHIDQAYKVATNEYQQNVEKLVSKLQALEELAKKVAGEWKGKMAIPSSSVKHVEQVEKAAGQMWFDLRFHGPVFEEFLKTVNKTKELLGSLAEKIKSGEKPTTWDYNWFVARKPTVGFEDDPSLKTAMDIIQTHLKRYTAADKNSTDPAVVRNRLTDLNQLTAGLDQAEVKLKAMINKCHVNRHKNTKVALEEYLAMCGSCRNQVKEWIGAERKKTVPLGK